MTELQINDQETKWCVYIHRNKINDKAYIGYTKNDPQKRWGKNGYGYKTQRAFARAIKKYPDWDNDWEHIIFMDNLSEEDAKRIEVLLIALFKTNCNRYNKPTYGYNMTDGGEGTTGNKMSEDARRKLSESHKGKGRPHTEESKRKLSIALSGKKKSEAHIKRLSEVRKGVKTVPCSEEKKEKIREANKRYQKAVVQMDVHNNFIAEFCSIHEASRISGVDYRNISACCTHHTNISGGYKWVYKDEYVPNLPLGYMKTKYQPIVRLDGNFQIIGVYKNMRVAQNNSSAKSCNIRKCCMGERKRAGGDCWMFLYDKIIQDGTIIPGAITLGLITEAEALAQLNTPQNN